MSKKKNPKHKCGSPAWPAHQDFHAPHPVVAAIMAVSWHAREVTRRSGTYVMVREVEAGRYRSSVVERRDTLADPALARARLDIIPGWDTAGFVTVLMVRLDGEEAHSFPRRMLAAQGLV